MSKPASNQQCAASTTQDTFEGFNPPQTTDGSYKGTMKKVKAIENHLQSKFDEKLEEVKSRLKASKCKVGISVRGSSIQLQATLPPKPDSDKVKPYQQLISLNIPANLDGLKTAEEEANELGRLIARKQFEWNEKYLGKKEEKARVPKIGELLDKFEIEYYKFRPKTINSETTFNNYITKIKRHFELDDELIQPVVDNRLSSIDSASSKSTCAISLSVLCSTFKININLTAFTKKKYKSRNESFLSDATIVDCYRLWEQYANSRSKRVNAKDIDAWKLYRWVYGMMATYGLRPRELFLYPDIAWWLSTENADNTWKVHESCKTGARHAFPLYKEWVELFDLKNKEYLGMLAELLKNKDKYFHFENVVNCNGKWFKKVGIPFDPYSLRHAWAIRAHMLGIPIKAASDNLGHSVDIHTRIYQSRFTSENTKLAINQAVNRKSEVDLLKDEVHVLRTENEKLKIEVERYRLMLNSSHSLIDS